MTDNRNIREMIRTIASEKPNFIYPSSDIDNMCFYRPIGNNNIRCIIGEALHRMGIPYNKEWEYKSADVVLEKIGGFATKDMHWCTYVQEKQDDDKTWSNAVNLADHVKTYSN